MPLKPWQVRARWRHADLVQTRKRHRPVSPGNRTQGSTRARIDVDSAP